MIQDDLSIFVFSFIFILYVFQIMHLDVIHLPFSSYLPSAFVTSPSNIKNLQEMKRERREVGQKGMEGGRKKGKKERSSLRSGSVTQWITKYILLLIHFYLQMFIAKSH